MTGYIESLLAEREKIILTARQHWFLLLSVIAFEIVIILIIISLTIIAGTYLAEFALFIGAAGAVLLLLPIVTMLRDILDWMNRQYIVSNRRVIQISGILNKNVTDSSLEKVTDVKMEQSAFGRLFDYGDIEILTASELGANFFRRLEDPIRFKTAMLNAKENLAQSEGEHRSGDEIVELFASLDRLRELGILSEGEFAQKKKELLSRM